MIRFFIKVAFALATWALFLGVVMAIKAHAYTITNDHGGWISDYAKDVLTTPFEVRIEGDCESACTMYLGARNVCVAPSAKLMFHSAYMAAGADHKRAVSISPNQAFNAENGTNAMMSFYNGALQAYLAIHGGLTPRPIWISGRQLIGMGYRECK